MVYLSISDKNALFEYFWARCLEELLSFLKSAHSSLSFAKFHEKTNITKFGTRKT